VPPVAVADIRLIESLSPIRPLGGRFLQPARRRCGLRGPEGVEPREADPALRARARAGEHGLQGGGRAHLPVEPGEPARPRCGCTT
jgi:hypothetical protein